MRKKWLIILLVFALSGCQWVSQTPLDISILEEAIIDIDNFEVHYYYEDDDYYYETDYRFEGENVEYSYEIDEEEYTEYFVLDETDSIIYYYYQDEKANWLRAPSGDAVYEEAASYMDYLDLGGIDPSQFTSKNGEFIPKSEYLQVASKAILGDYDEEGVTETYEYLRIKVQNNHIQKIYAESNYVDSEGTIHYSFVLTFSDWGNVTITLPILTEVTKYDEMPISIPSTGTVKGLVVPINFLDDSFTAQELTDLTIAFNGSATETGWESVKTYYQESSYQKLNLSFTILPAFQTGKNISYYEAMYEEDYPEDEIMAAVLAYYDGSIDFSEYDSDDDGEIDAIYLIYAAPVDYEDDSLWWAWVTYFYEEEPTTYDGVSVNYYMWAGADFMYDVMDDNETEWSYDDVYVTVNSTTYVHETGHLLGLDDYYDYDLDNGPAGGLGGADMMDMAVGDHNAATKYLLGWIDPTIITDSTTIQLESFGTTVSAYIIYKDEVSPFSEYIIIEFFTPDGLNDITKGYCGLFSTYGVLIYHVDARMDSSIGDSGNEIYDTPFSFNNSTSDHKFIRIIEGDGNNSIEDTSYSEYGEYASNDDLFQLNDVLSSYTWYDGTSIGYTILVTAMTSSGASVTITSTK